jgi:NitT/TauT family transport system substrate-binding protein
MFLVRFLLVYEEEHSMQIIQSRRHFLGGLSAIAAADVIGFGSSIARAEPPPETSTVRLSKLFDATCEAAKDVAGDLLRDEGFSDVRWVDSVPGLDTSDLLARGDLDFDYNFPAVYINSLEAGAPVIVLTGMHAGCLELIVNNSIGSVADLKGKKVGVDKFTSHPHVLVTVIATLVGLDPVREIDWVTSKDTTPMQMFIEGKIDAFLATSPEPQMLRAQKMGHSIVNTSLDHPWKQYYCCMLGTTVEYLNKHPVATKRVMRALLKAADLCVSNPTWIAQQMVARGFASNYDLALETLKEARYDVWREYDPEDTLRFFALRMHEAGFIKQSPQKLISQGTDWRFLIELKRELRT